MIVPKLPPDATIEYLVRNGLLHKPIDWLSRVLTKVREKRDDRGPYCVRIGLSGAGHSPNYRIEPIAEPEATEDDHRSIFLQGTFSIPDTPLWSYKKDCNTFYSGKSHEVLEHGVDRENWSSKATRFDAMQQIFMDLHRSTPSTK